MNPKYSILLHSEYSSRCQDFLNIVSQLNLQLQYLCVDNTKVRQRILEDRTLDIRTVPCLLIIYDNGTVEKYEGEQAFMWLSVLVPRPEIPKESKSEPLSDMLPTDLLRGPAVMKSQGETSLRSQPQRAPPVNYKKSRKQNVLNQPQPKQVSEEEMPMEYYEKFPSPIDEPVQETPSRPVNRLPKKTPLENLPDLTELEEEIDVEPVHEVPPDDTSDDLSEDLDRHIIKPQPKRIREGHRGYYEDDNLFSGEPVNNRREPSNIIKPKISNTDRDLHGILAKAKEMEKDRSSIENNDMRRMGRTKPIGQLS